MTTADPYADIAAAKQEAAEAEQLLAALEERVREGDAKVKPAQLAEQRELSRFAALRVEAAHRKLQRATDAEVKAVRDQYAAEIRALADSDTLDLATVAAAYASMREAAADFTAVCDAYNTTWNALRVKIEGAPFAGHADVVEDVGVSVRKEAGHPKVVIGDRSLHRIRTGDHLARAIHEAASTEQHTYAANLRRDLAGPAKNATRYQPDLAGGAQ